MAAQSTILTGLSENELKETLAEICDEEGGLPPEREMVDKFGLSRARLRRILSEMREESLLPPARIGRRSSRDTNPQVESLVRLANPTDVIEMRLIIEPQLARLAALKASSLETARITRAADGPQDGPYGAPDLAFHLEIASSTRNALAREMYRMLRMVSADARVFLPDNRPPCPNRRKIRDEEHMQIAKAIAARDPERAEAKMRDHLLAVRGVILDRMSPDFSAGSRINSEAN